MSPGKHKTLPQKKHVASSQENKTTKKEASFFSFLSFFSSSGGGHFRRDSVQGPPFHQPDLYHSPRPTISFCTRPTTTTCSAATFRMTTEGVVLERFKKRTNLASFASKRKEILSSWCCF
jgi:hypothetical protein